MEWRQLSLSSQKICQTHENIHLNFMEKNVHDDTQSQQHLQSKSTIHWNHHEALDQHFWWVQNFELATQTLSIHCFNEQLHIENRGS